MNENIYSKYIEALNMCSIESWEGYFEDLNSQGELADEDLRSIEQLPVKAKVISYALAILSCTQCADYAKKWAIEKLHSLS